MFLTSKSSPMASHGATTFPDLSLQISPPVAADEYHMKGCITNRPPSTSSSGSDFSQETTFNHHIAADMAGGLLDLQFGQPRLTLGLEMGTLNHHHHHRHHPNYWNHHYHPPQIYPHQFKRSSRNVNGVRRSARAPRMRWTSTLHAHFIHAVQLLGGHERATPKSVQELMNVKDLTLAHVKSHLQMYRTVKSTDKGITAAGHGQTGIGLMNPRPGINVHLHALSPICDTPNLPDPIQSSHRTPWQSSIETKTNNRRQEEPEIGLTYSHLKVNNNNNETTVDGHNNYGGLDSTPLSRSEEAMLDLEFTLGRPNWQKDHTESSRELTLLKC